MLGGEWEKERFLERIRQIRSERSYRPESNSHQAENNLIYQTTGAKIVGKALKIFHSYQPFQPDEAPEWGHLGGGVGTMRTKVEKRVLRELATACSARGRTASP